MNDEGFKISTPGNDVETAALADLVVSSSNANLKCDLRSNPRNYGLVNWSIANLPFNVPTIIHQHKHGYSYAPSFIDAWSYPAGTVPANKLSNSTFGIGNQDGSLGNGLVIKCYTDNVNFYIVATNSSLFQTALTNLSGQIRFFVYADDFVPSQPG